MDWLMEPIWVLYLVLGLLILCCILTQLRLMKIESWIKKHQKWSKEQHSRQVLLEQSFCAVEKFAHDGTNPPPSSKFCTGGGGGPGDGFGGSAPPENGF